MSTIFADKFKNTSGGNPVQINQLRGIDTAGSITVQGEGTNTTNLQQGLLKVWLNMAANGASIDDSFNISSVTDNAAGNLNPQYANVFSGTSNLAMTVGARNSGTSGMVYTAALVSSTGQGGFVHYENGSTADPLDWTGLQISGDLA